MKRVRHTNNGKCPKCQEILDAYPGFYQPLRDWFEAFQLKHPEAHISEAGRGRVEQEMCFMKGTSLAHYEESGHNWNCALDLFEMMGDLKNIYEKEWFDKILAAAITDDIQWGWRWKGFKERPHVEWKNWKELADKGILKLVE